MCVVVSDGRFVGGGEECMGEKPVGGVVGWVGHLA